MYSCCDSGEEVYDRYSNITGFELLRRGVFPVYRGVPLYNRVPAYANHPNYLSSITWPPLQAMHALIDLMRDSVTQLLFVTLSPTTLRGRKTVQGIVFHKIQHVFLFLRFLANRLSLRFLPIARAVASPFGDVQSHHA